MSSRGSYPNPGVAGSNNTTNNHRGCSGFLPSSAPVSSLLPPIPDQQPHHHDPLAALSSVLSATASSSSSTTSTLHQQLAALLQGSVSVTPPSFLPQQQQPLPPAPAVPAPPPKPTLSHPQLLALSQVQQASWSLDQLEQHVSLLQRLQQPIPPNTALLLADARNRAQKRHAKRMANRKSACTSRARKKELVREMTELNTRLRRQALILSLLPDMVIAMDPQGRITFCSGQVERVVRRSIDHELIGANITDILEPGSQKELLKLVQQLLGRKKTVPTSEKGEGGERKCKKHKTTGNNNNSSSTSGKGDNTISDKLLHEKKQHHFPLQVVQVDAARSDENGDNSDASKQPPSSLTNSFALDVNSGGSDNDNAVTAGSSKKKAPKANTATTSSDSSSNSEGGPPSLSPSNPNRNLCFSANANLERNVRWHNKNRNAKHSGYKDDVNGAAVTANNASARLSSLQHMGSSSEEDDSGYRESNESREETSSSSEGESSAGEGRRRVLAPTCNVCLIRKDLTTIWCEVTSSLRRKETTNQADGSSVTSTKKASHTSSSSASVNDSSSKAGIKKRSAEEANLEEEEDNALEILLCLRPIHDGLSSSDKSSADGSKQQRIVSEVNTSSGGDDGGTGEDSSDSKLGATGDSSDSMSSSHKRGKTGRDRKKTNSDIKNDHMDDVAVASLIAMAKRP